ncbi:MAG: DUF1292 domain-containing protein [Ruminococcaceae bacterium]|nr:DUF1292 domain-containing protein [Oscillospiraceae bacterium]
MSQTPIEKLLDEKNSDPITLYTEAGEEVTLEQVAIIPLQGRCYAILKPLGAHAIGEDEALVFELVPEDADWSLEIVLEDDIIDAVFAVYYKLLSEEGNA